MFLLEIYTKNIHLKQPERFPTPFAMDLTIHISGSFLKDPLVVENLILLTFP